MKPAAEATTRWSIRVERGIVLVLSNSGVLTLKSQLAGREAVSDAAAAFRAKGVLVDLRKAAFLMSDEDWAHMTTPEFWVRGRLDLPVAYVIPETVEEKGLDYCAAMCAHGLERASFTDFGCALAWCVWRAGGGLDLQEVSPSAP